MQSFLRITVLGMFAAAGVALAVPVALQPAVPGLPVIDGPSNKTLDQTENEQSDSVSEAPTPASETAPASATAGDAGHVEAPSPARQDPQMTHAAMMQLVPSAAWTASYQPPVTRQFDQLQQAIDSIQANQAKTADALSQLRQDLPGQQPPAEPAAPPPPLAEPSNDPPAPKPEPKVEFGQFSDNVNIDFDGSDVRVALQVLGKAAGLNILTSPQVTGFINLSLEDVEVHRALEAVLKSTGYVARYDGNLVYVGTPEDLHSMAVPRDVIATRVYRPSYVSAAEVQQLITPLTTEGFGVIAISAEAQVGIGSNSSEAGGDSFAGGEIVLVRDYEAVLAEIDEVIAEVDRMPMQVAIEAMILSVKLDDRNELGVDFELLRHKDTIRVVSGTPLASLATAPFDEGLKVGFLDSSMFAFIEAMETIGDTNVIAAPRILCLNKQRAEILIGSELGYVSTTVTETAATQSVEFLEVGTHLRIRPFISPDGMVRMEVHPELSQGSVRVESGFTLPDKEVTQVTTNIMCRSNSTVVIGGLIREDLITTASQIPVLGSLPLVGAVFRQKTEDIERREIIVLLTPRIIDEVQAAEEGQKYAGQFGDRRDVFLDKMSPLGKRHHGERYARLAVAAWSAGDGGVALRYANLAIHYDPLHQGAIDLRGQILAAYPGLEMGVHHHLKTGLPPWGHPVRDYSRHGWPTQVPEPIYAPPQPQPLGQ